MFVMALFAATRGCEKKEGTPLFALREKVPAGAMVSTVNRIQLWTIQPRTVWTLLNDVGLLYVDKCCTYYRGFTPRAYTWLQEHLYCHLHGYSGHLMWWGTCEKPDLRSYRHRFRIDDERVRLAITVPADTIVTFPAWAWNKVYCGDYLALNSAEYSDWIGTLRQAVPHEDTWPLPEPWNSRLERSWNRLFMPNLPRRSWDTESWPQLEGMEAVFEVLNIDDVREAKLFTGTVDTATATVDAQRDAQRGHRKCRSKPAGSSG
jgi:hypothetical protein